MQPIEALSNTTIFWKCCKATLSKYC